MKTIKWIDILIKIAKGEEVPKKIKWNNLAYKYQILLYDKEEKEYVYENDKDQFCDVPNHHLNDEVEIIEDTSKENKKIEHLDLDDLYEIMVCNDYDEDMKKHVIHKSLIDIKSKINEIIDKVNKENKNE